LNLSYVEFLQFLADDDDDDDDDGGGGGDDDDVLFSYLLLEGCVTKAQKSL
jgi:hypothetical protein